MPGMILPRTSSPIDSVDRLAASDQLVVFQAIHFDRSQALYAIHAGETVLVISTGDLLDGREVVGLYLNGRDDSIEGGRATFEATLEDGARVVYVVTVGVARVPGLGLLGGLVAAVAVAVTVQRRFSRY